MKIFNLFVLLFLSFSLFAQKKDTAFFLQHFRLGEKLMLENKIDSALINFHEANNWRNKNPYFDTSIYVTRNLSHIGRCYRLVEKPQLSQEYLFKALLNARKNKQEQEYRLIHARLNFLHKTIAEKNWAFNYPTITETETNEVYFPIKSVKPYGKDSLEIYVEAGRLDGIVNDSQYCRLSSRIIKDDTLYHNNVNTKTSAPIFQLKNNSLIIHISNVYQQKVLAEDFVVCNVETPVSWNKLKLKKLLLLNDIFRYNTDDYYSYRFYYYYGTEEIEQEAMFSMLDDVKRTAYNLAKDTLTNKDFATKYDGGIFSGENMLKAIILSKPIHQQLFLEYEVSVPANNMGNYPSFASEFGTWVATGSKLNAASIEPYLSNIQDGEYKKSQIKNLFSQIKKSNLVEQWLANAMQNASEENYEAARKTANLMQQVVYQNNDTANFGWPEFLMANIERRDGDTVKAQKYLQQANQYFVSTNNYEGKILVRGIEDSWQNDKQLNITTQRGHTLPFITALSPNGKYFATGSYDNQIKIWDKVAGKEIKTIGYHLNTITALSYSPNGKYLISASEDKQLQIWDTYNYTPVAGFKFEGVVNVAKFSPNSKLLYLAEDSLLYIINPFTDTFALVKKMKLHNGIINDFVFYKNDPDIIYSVGDDSLLCKWNVKEEKRITKYTYNSKVKSITISNDNRYIATTSTDSILQLLDLFLGDYVVSRKTYLDAMNYSDAPSSLYAVQSFSSNSKYLSFPAARDSFRIYNLADLYSRKYKADIGDYNLRAALFTKDGNDLLLMNDGYKIKMINTTDYDFNNKSSINSKDISFYANQINRIQYSADDNAIHYIQFGPTYGKIDLTTGKNFTRYATTIYMPKGKFLSFKNDDVFPIKPTKKSNSLAFYSVKSESIIDSIFVNEAENIISLDKTSDDKIYFLSTEKGSVIAWDVEKKAKKFATKIETDESINSMILHYDKYRNRLLFKATTNYILVLNAMNGVVSDTIFINQARDIGIAKDNFFITTAEGRFRILDANTLLTKTTWSINNTNTEAYNLLVCNKEKNVIVQNTLNSFKVYDVALDTFIYSSGNLQFTANDIAISNSEKEFALAGFDGAIRLFDAKTYHLKATIHLPYKKDAFIVDSLNHYFVTKNSLDAVNVNYNEHVYPYDQFDIQLNRPDIVLNNLGRSDSNLIKSYATAYQKRLKSLGVVEKKNNNDLHLPKLKLKNKFNIQTSTSSNTYTINIECSDDKYKLQSLQVLVNNSPMLGVNGKNLSTLKTNFYQQQITVPLANGTNKIKIYCTNENGSSSLKETFTVLSTFTDTTHKATLYFVGIGVAKYKDTTFNLTYSAKDIRDLAKDANDYYAHVVIDTLLNENVTIENILKLKQRLQKTKPDDRVVVAITGHGLLSDSLDFYYATYDVNFQNPQKRGLKYEIIENFLNDVPAQEKIMFIDACHSGALDKEELLAIQKNKKLNVGSKTEEQKKVTGIASRSTITIKNKEKKVSANSNFELMQNTFSNLGNSNGAIIVSAAGGMEYAFESPQWNNGVFTFAIREGWFLKYADQYYIGNKDGAVTVEELVAYINGRVSDLTNGKQKPNSRKENLDFNWVIRY